MNKGFVILLLICIPFCAGAVIGYKVGHVTLSGSSGQMQTSGGDEHPYTPEQRDSVSETVTSSRQNAITRTVAKVSGAVVGINVIEEQVYRYRSPWGDDPFFRHFFGDQEYRQKVQGLGSGFLISSDGYILTNDHVAGNAKEITVTLTNGEKYKAKLIGTDQISDIALIKIEGSNLPFLRMGNSDDVLIGEWVIAFGNPFGLFDISDKPTVTVGVVSATKMNLQAQEGRTYRGMIQTDAAINSGNSGGPLVNTMAEVIGLNSVIYTPNQGSIGLGFAIPINRVKKIVEQLKSNGKIERQFWTGLEVQNVDVRIARYFNLEKAEGVIVSDVQKSSPGSKAGFLTGDIITSVGTERVADDATLMAILNDTKVGDSLVFKVLRDRKEITLTMKLERRPN
jgi:serine protease Do